MKEVWTYSIVLSPTVSVELENSVLRAARSWEVATLGEIRFDVLLHQEATPPCTDALVGIDELDTPLDGEDEVGRHVKRTCHDVSIRNPWPDRARWDAIYARLGVSPLVMVVAHELGHVLGLRHVSPTERSVMIPTIDLAIVPGPSCGDVSSLGFQRDRPLRCYEERRTP